MDYEYKYIKYKNKYLNLKYNKNGGDIYFYEFKNIDGNIKKIDKNKYNINLNANIGEKKYQ